MESMTVLTVGVVATVVTAGAAAPALAAAATGATSAGGAAAGAVAGGAAVGSATSAGVTTIATGIASGPVGWLVLGAEQDAATHHQIGATFDCWKPVLRDESTEPSSGKFLNDIFKDQRVKRIVVGESTNEFHLPQLSLVNIWDEQFDINYLVLPSNNQLVAHAVRAA